MDLKMNLDIAGKGLDTKLEELQYLYVGAFINIQNCETLITGMEKEEKILSMEEIVALEKEAGEDKDKLAKVGKQKTMYMAKDEQQTNLKSNIQAIAIFENNITFLQKQLGTK